MRFVQGQQVIGVNVFWTSGNWSDYDPSAQT